MISSITPLIITFDEAPNIVRTLDKLTWARRIVVVDSGSTDGTLDLLARYPQVQRFDRIFDSFAEQCNYGLDQIDTEWVLSLDADYELSGVLVRELARLAPAKAVAGFQASFIYRVYGRPLRGTLYPPRTVLYRVCGARYVNQGHGHKVLLAGEVGSLRGVIYHDDRKPLPRWIASQHRYAVREADYLLQSDRGGLKSADRIRRMAWLAPLAVFCYVLIYKGCILDGWAGWYYALQRLLAEVMIAIELIDRRLGGTTHKGSSIPSHGGGPQ